MKKGFTLIELLAVIVILAVIALISIPLILGIIENSKKSAFKDSVLLSFSAAELYETNNTVSESGIEIKNLKMKNNNFKYGKIIKNSNNELVAVNVSDGEYCATGTINSLSVSKGECDPNIPSCTYEITEGTKGLDNWYITSPTIEFVTSKANVSGLYYGVGFAENYESTVLNENETKTITSDISTNFDTTTINGYVKSGADKKSTCSVTLKVDTSVPLAPEVTGTNTTWTKNKTINITTPTSKSGISKYEYYVSDSNVAPNASVTVTGSTTTNDLIVTTTGKYIYFRTVNNAGVTGSWGNAENLYVDSIIPTVNTSVLLKVGTINLSDNYNLSSYTVTTTTDVPTVWNDITGLNSVQSYTATVAGTYYAWVKDLSGNTAYKSFVITAGAFCSYAEGKVWSFAYTGALQNFAIPCDGTYKIDVAGGSTPTVTQSFYCGTNCTYPTQFNGAKGGLATAKFNFVTNENLKITVGYGITGTWRDTSYANFSYTGYPSSVATNTATLMNANGASILQVTGYSTASVTDGTAGSSGGNPKTVHTGWYGNGSSPGTASVTGSGATEITTTTGGNALGTGLGYATVTLVTLN